MERRNPKHRKNAATSLVSARALQESFPRGLTAFFFFLQKYTPCHCSSGKVLLNSFVPNARTQFLSSGTESSTFPTIFLHSKRGLRVADSTLGRDGSLWPGGRCHFASIQQGQAACSYCSVLLLCLCFAILSSFYFLFFFASKPFDLYNP